MSRGVNSPHGFEDWLALLLQHDVGRSFHGDTGSLLRVIAGTKNGAVCLASGREAIPYVHWLQDGMAMNSRLIVHNQSPEMNDLVRPQFTTDIRIVTHTQDLASFLTDIEEHRFDLIVLDVNDLSPDAEPPVLLRLAEHGLLLGVGADAARSHLIQTCTDAYFLCSLGNDGQSVALSKKGIQHRAVRRGGRRGRRAAGDRR